MINSIIQKLGLHMNPETKHNFFSDFGAAVIFSLFNVAFNQFYMPFAIRQGASNVEVGLLAAAPAIGLLFSPLWAGWMQQRSPKPFVIIPNLIGRLLLLIPAFFGAPAVYVTTALVYHLLMGIQAPAYATLVTRMYQPELRGRLMGYVRVAMGALMIPLAYIVGLWTDQAGPSGPLVAAALTGGLSILSLARVREFPVKTSGTTRRSTFMEQIRLVSKHRGLLVFFAATTLSGFGNILASPLYQIVQVNELQLNNAQIGIARMAYYLCLLTAFFVVGWAIDRYSARHTLVYGIAAFAIVPMLYGLFPSYTAVIIGSGVQGIGDAIWDIGILAFVFRVMPGKEGIVFGLHLMLFGIRGTIAPLLSTALTDHVPLAALFLAASLFGWLGTLLFAWKAKEADRESAME
ncbi:MFS transporter [Paenibacillus chartarius]|uniref:MFS transporter n=1 Tax=Paenibacillus chartarius TaxID=747481 RepID=A0ABV6DPA8_9BACL